jgi:hypothetical protein
LSIAHVETKVTPAAANITSTKVGDNVMVGIEDTRTFVHSRAGVQTPAASAGTRPLLGFLLACVAIIPLAGLLGFATEKLAARVGDAIGGFRRVSHAEDSRARQHPVGAALGVAY